MKERTFYTINLDIKRISILISIFLLLIVYSFILGHTLGKRKAEKEWKEESESSRPVDRESKKQKEAPPPEPERQIVETPVSEPVKADPGPPLEEEIPETPDFAPVKAKKPKKDKPSPSEKKLDGESEPDFYTLQLGAFSGKDQALKFKEEFLEANRKLKKYKPYIMKNGDLYTVRMGRALSKEDIEKEKNRLQSEIKKDIIIVRVKQN